MLTVKHIAPSGHETIHETDSTATEPKAPNRDNLTCVYYGLPNGGMERLATGTVYVMNEAGNTVAVYHLGGWDEPEDENAGNYGAIGTGGVQESAA